MISKSEIEKVINRMDKTHRLKDIDKDDLCTRCVDALEYGIYDFSSYEKEILTQSGKKRVVYYFDKWSVENIICQYLKKRLDREFDVKFASRNKIINLLFNMISALKNMHDFVIVRVDFKAFFDSVLSDYVYQQYIRTSLLDRNEKDVLEEYIQEFKYCYAGLCLSNTMTEIISRRFDQELKARLSDYGLFFYERYVDDMLIVLNSFISKDDIFSIINEIIHGVFRSCPVKLSTSDEKTTYISRRTLPVSEKFNFLGYEFFINNVGGKITFEYGITEKKRNRYCNIIERAFRYYSINHDVELLRQQLKIYSSRVVVARMLDEKVMEWLTKGLVANYNELSQYTEFLHPDTEKFLKNLYYDLLKKYHLRRPYFIRKDRNEDSIYNLLSNMRRNRTLMFEEKIGVSKVTLLEWIRRLNPSYSDYGKNYYRIVMEYLTMLKIE